MARSGRRGRSATDWGATLNRLAQMAARADRGLVPARLDLPLYRAMPAGGQGRGGAAPKATEAGREAKRFHALSARATRWIC
jgi:hypothetical protein